MADASPGKRVAKGLHQVHLTTRAKAKEEARLTPMRYRFLLHALHHKVLSVNITSLSPNIAGVTPNESALPFQQFGSWAAARAHFLELGASPESVDDADQSLRKTSTAVLTIL